MIESESNKQPSLFEKIRSFFSKSKAKNIPSTEKNSEQGFSEETIEHRKYDGFSDEETRLYAYDLGARNIKQLHLIQKYNAPDYETVKKIQSGNFKNYREYKEAVAIGASNETQVIFIQKYHAPDLKTALNIEKGGFNDYQEYQEALSKGASSVDELKLLKKFNAPDMTSLHMIQKGNFATYEEFERAQEKGASTKEELEVVDQMQVQSYQEASQILQSGFKDTVTYRLALSKGLLKYSDWDNYIQKREKKLKHYGKMRKDIPLDQILREFNINDVRELLKVLEPLNVPLMGDKVLFSFDYDLYKDKGYNEFELNELIGLDADNDICAICMRELVGPTGTCPQCQEKGHYDCLSTWIIDKHSCPTCRKPLNVLDIKLSESKEKRVRHIKCILCKKVINPLERVINCTKCSTIYHKEEFLEYIKIKGSCLICGQTMKI